MAAAAILAWPVIIEALIWSIVIAGAISVLILLLRQAAGYIPFIGATVANWATTVGDSIYNFAAARVDAAVQPLAQALYTPIYRIKSYHAALNNTIWAIVHWIDHSPAILGRYIGVGQYVSTFTAIQEDLNHIIADATDMLDKPYFSQAQIQNFIWQNVVSRQVGELINDDTMMKDSLTTELGYATGNLWNAVYQVQADAVRLFNDAATNQLNIGNLARQIGDLSPSVVDAAIAAAVGAAVGAIDLEIGKVQTQLDEIIATLTPTIALTVATTATLTRYLEECGMPMCNQFRKQIGSQQEISSILDDGLLFGLLVEIMRNPQESAKAITDVVTPIGRALTSMVEGLSKT